MLKPEHIYALLIMLTQSGIADNEAMVDHAFWLITLHSLPISQLKQITSVSELSDTSFRRFHNINKFL